MESYYSTWLDNIAKSCLCIFSMASGEFLAARSEGRGDALKSCSYTGIAYLVTVALLILHYLIFDSTRYMTELVS